MQFCIDNTVLLCQCHICKLENSNHSELKQNVPHAEKVHESIVYPSTPCLWLPNVASLAGTFGMSLNVE